jgi:hypothetical protein
MTGRKSDGNHSATDSNNQAIHQILGGLSDADQNNTDTPIGAGGISAATASQFPSVRDRLLPTEAPHNNATSATNSAKDLPKVVLKMEGLGPELIQDDNSVPVPQVAMMTPTLAKMEIYTKAFVEEIQEEHGPLPHSYGLETD